MASVSNPHSAVCLVLTRAIGRARTVDDIYTAALDALAAGLGVTRASILLFDADGVMRFVAWRGLSADYRAAVDGHSPWTPEDVDPEPIHVADVAADAALAPFGDTFRREGIAAMTFIPLVSPDRVIGKFMLYFDAPQPLPADALQLSSVIAAQVAFAVARTRTEAQARRSEERLRFALDAASMGTWDWDMVRNTVRWSDNLERIHGLPEGTFDGSFGSYEREIHPDDRERVLASIRRALDQGVPHEVEYRIVAPDGTVRWCEGKGRVEVEDGVPVRMSGVCMMVTRRKEAELARLAAAEEASRLKDEFLATLSHELRTPMNAILGWVQMLQQGTLPPERARQAIDVVARNARLQAQLIEDVLDVSRIITNKLALERVPVSVPAVVETAVEGVAPEAAARGIRIGTTLSDALPPVQADPKRLHQVLNNVLSNAVKFTPEGGWIALTCDLDGPWLRLAVRDSGPGIPPEFLPYVFDRFRQADSRATRAHGGLGLGLAIARHLVEQHGGRIDAHSDGPGTGTTIVMRLPVGTGPTLVAAGGDDEPSETSLDGLRVLVVDDQEDSRSLVVALLEQSGATVAACASAEEALTHPAVETSDLLIADIAMPGVDGYELVRRLRARGVEVPAIAVTAYARLDDRQEALSAGFTGYCAKPLDAGLLLRTARALVRLPHV